MRARIGRAAFVVAAIGGMSLVGIGMAQAATFTVTAVRDCGGDVTVTGSTTDYEAGARLGFTVWPQDTEQTVGARRGTVVTGDEDADGTYATSDGDFAEVVELSVVEVDRSDSIVNYKFGDSPLASDAVQLGTAPIQDGCTTFASAGRACDGTVTVTVEGRGLEPERLYSAEASVEGGELVADGSTAGEDGSWSQTLTLDYGQVGQDVDYRVYTPPTVRNTVDTGTAFISDQCPTTNGSRILGTRDCATPDTILLGFDARGFADDTYTLRVTSPGFTALTGTDAALTAEYDIEGSIQGNDELGDPARVRISRAAVTAGYQLLASDGSVALAGTFDLDDCGGDPSSNPGTGIDPGTGTGTGPSTGTGTGTGTVPVAGTPTTKPAPVAAGHGTTPRALASTGSPVGSLALLGGGLVLAGGVAAAGARFARR